MKNLMKVLKHSFVVYWSLALTSIVMLVSTANACQERQNIQKKPNDSSKFIQYIQYIKKQIPNIALFQNIVELEAELDAIRIYPEYYPHLNRAAVREAGIRSYLEYTAKLAAGIPCENLFPQQDELWPQDPIGQAKIIGRNFALDWDQ
ncbi:MAG: hypothetical protein HQK53_07775 [Oligoflexia bacterium]|nr:hypothetical protein [Oligoflexia bacterium]